MSINQHGYNLPVKERKKINLANKSKPLNIKKMNLKG